MLHPVRVARFLEATWLRLVLHAHNWFQPIVIFEDRGVQRMNMQSTNILIVQDIKEYRVWRVVISCGTSLERWPGSAIRTSLIVRKQGAAAKFSASNKGSSMQSRTGSYDSRSSSAECFVKLQRYVCISSPMAVAV
jgi:hypothetical protein